MENNKKFIALWIFLATVFSYFLISILNNCAVVKVKPIETQTQISKEVEKIQEITVKPINLSWEVDHSKRAIWSQLLIKYITESFDHLDKAQDMVKYCPNYKALNKDQKINAWAEFFVALAYYESSWNPEESDVDVGEDGDSATYSTGLWQVSAADWESYNLQKILPHFSYNELLTVEPNIRLTMALMNRQMDKQALICVDHDVYWSTLSCKTFARYEENNGISQRVQKALSFCK